MKISPQNNTPTLDELVHWAKTSGESDYIDAKGPVMWDGAKSSASLAKDIVSFANSKDGGVLVIGKSESGDGGFRYDGLTPEQATSFDTTKVGQWVNAHFEPSIRLACHHVEYETKTLIVIVIQQFEDIPVMCIKALHDPTKPKDLLLRPGTIYIRNGIAESKPITTVDELRELIGLAIRRKGDELLAHFNAMLKGRSLSTVVPVPNPFENEIARVRGELKIPDNVGGWWMTFRPSDYDIRWPTPGHLEQLIRQHSVRVYDGFPAYRYGTFNMEWGIANDYYGEIWSLTKSGMFCLWKEFRENRESTEPISTRGSYEASKPIPPGEWVEFNWSIVTAVSFFMFLSRFTDSFDAGQEINISISVGPLSGRRLVSVNHNVSLGWGFPSHCRAPWCNFERTMSVEEMKANWEEICSQFLKQLFDLFPDHQVSQKTLLQWVERYKTRPI